MSHPIPTAALDDRLGVVGTSGSGKTYGASGAVERLLARKSRVVWIDPLGVAWGIRLMADGKTPSPYEVVIFGGPHGDMPITEHAGAIIGETVASMKESAIIDLSELGTKAAERRFMLAFLTALYKHASGEQLHIIFDEADMWAPQQIRDRDQEPQKLLGMMETIVRRGRIKGFVPWLIAQRPAVVNKDVLSQVDGLVAFKLTSSQDRGALKAWVEGQADVGEWPRIYAELPTKQVGEAIVWLPGHGKLESAKFPEKATFDSSRAPKKGERRKTAELAPLDLGKLKDRLAQVEQEAKQNDPKALKSRILELERQVAGRGSAGGTGNRLPHPKNAGAPPVPDSKAIERARDAGYAIGFESARQEIEPLARELFNAAGVLRSAADLVVTATKAIDRWVSQRQKKPPMKAPAELHAGWRMAAKEPPMPESLEGMAQLRPDLTARAAAADRRSARGNGADTTGDTKLGAGERRILTAIAQTPGGVTREGLTVMTGYKRSSRNTYTQRLSQAGLIETSGDRLIVTEVGMDTLGPDFEPLPTGHALREYWLRELPEGERRLFEQIVSAYPNQVDRSDIGERAGYKRSSTNTYLQRLAARDLIVSRGGSVSASEDLFA